MVRLTALSEVPPGEVEGLLDAAFGPERKTRTAYKLREGTRPTAELSFAAYDREALVGSVQCWPVMLQPSGQRLTLVGPVAVRPEVQRGGIGQALMRRCLEAADMHGHDALVMIGDPEYYGRFFGFSSAATQGWALPGPVERHRLLARITRLGGVAEVGRLGPALATRAASA